MKLKGFLFSTFDKVTGKKVGGKLKNGNIYAGVSSKTGKRLSVPDPDAGIDMGPLMTIQEAAIANSQYQPYREPMTVEQYDSLMAKKLERLTFGETQEALSNLNKAGVHLRLPTV